MTTTFNTDFSSPTLVEALEKVTDLSHSITFINGQDDEHAISYGELKRRALGLLYQFQRQGVQKGDELILYVDRNELFLDCFWACQLGGIVVVPLAIGPGDEPHRKVINVFEQLQSPWLYSGEKTLQRLERFATANDQQQRFEKLSGKTILAEQCSDLEQPGEAAVVERDDIAFIQFSSGSTGDPKGVVLTHHNVTTNVRAIIAGMGIYPTDKSLSWMPLTHDMGIIGLHLAPLTVGGPQHLMPTELFVRRPLLWLKTISDKRITITASPNFGIKHLLKRFKPERETGLDLASLRMIVNGAEPISAELCNQFAEVMRPFGYSAGAMMPVYGLAEASLAVTFSEREKGISSLHLPRQAVAVGESVTPLLQATTDTIEMVRVGTPVNDIALRIADATGSALEDGKVGHILIRGDSVTRGYYRADSLNQQLFKGDGWLDTGDLGFIDTDRGELVITGREKELIIVHGQNFHPQDLEQLCEAIKGCELGKTAICGLRDRDSETDELVFFVWFKSSAEAFLPIATAIRALLSEQTGLDLRHVVPVRTIPKTTSGKVQRHLLAEQYLAGEYDAATAELEGLMSRVAHNEAEAEGDIEQAMLTICNQVIEDRTVSVSDNLFEIGISSLKLAELHEQLEQHFPNVLEVTDLFDYPTVGELAAFIEQKMAE